MPPESREDPPVTAPLNRMQQEMLRRQDLLGSQIYTIGNVTWIEGPLRADRLRQAIRDWVAAEPVLRAAVQKDLQGARWVVSPALHQDMIVQDESDAAGDAAESERRVRACVARIRLEGIDPSHAPLWRFLLLDLGGQRHAWITYFHHLLLDGFGIQVFWQKVRQRYNRLLEAGVLEEAVPGPPFDRLAREELEAARDPARLARHRQFWERRFPPPQRQRFPRLPPSVKDVLPRLIERRWEIPRAQWAQLESQAKRLGIWPSHAVMALLTLHCARLAQLRELVVAVPLHNRLHEEDRGALGLYLSVLPLRLAIDPQGGFAAAARAFAREFRLALMHRQWPTADLLAQQPARGGIAGMPFDLVLSLERFDYAGAFGTAAARVEAFGGHPALAPVAAYARTHRPQAELAVDFVVDPRAPAAFTGGDAFGARLDRLLAEVLEDPERPIADPAP